MKKMQNVEIIDPAWACDKVFPEKGKYDGSGVWLYLHYDREAFLLEKMVREKNEARLKVGYTDHRKIPSGKAVFASRVKKGDTLSFRAAGKIKVLLNDTLLLENPESDLLHFIDTAEDGMLYINLQCDNVQKNIPALFLPGKENISSWSVSDNGKDFSPPVWAAPLINGKAPHHAEQEKIPLSAEKIAENLWDAGREILGYIYIHTEEDAHPVLYVGESLAEVKNRESADEEQTRELIHTAPGIWRSKVLLAFRYAEVENIPSGAELSIEAEFHSVCYRGVFSLPGEETLEKIWLQSCYTLRLCMKNFLLDGIKRDRLPWAGDLAVSLLSNAYSFHDKEIVKDTLSVLGAMSVEKCHVNSIIDYTLWYLINHEYFQMYYGDRAFLLLEYPRIRETLEILLKRRDENGFLTADPAKVWLFIDWVNEEKFTALQIIFFRALRSGAVLAKMAQDETFAAKLDMEAERLAGKIKEKAFDKEKGLFTSVPGKKDYTRHPNLLAVDFDLVTGKEAEKIACALMGKELPKVGTPYMSVFEAMAIARGGGCKMALQKIHEIWGGMLKEGATSFWEGFDPDHKGDEHYVFYGRPYGKSLCHAWGAGPAFLLPQLLFGIEPLSCSWRTFKVSPVENLTAAIRVPTPYGDIEVECVDGKITFLSAPEECRRI